MVQYYWKCSVQLWSLYIAAELERVQRGATRMLARSFHKWRNKWCLHFMTCYCRFFIFSSFSTNLPKRPIPIPPPSILQPPFPQLFSRLPFPWWLDPSCSPGSLTLHPEVPPDFRVLKISVHTLSSTSFPLQLPHCKTVGTLFQSCDFGPSNSGISYGWFGTT